MKNLRRIVSMLLILAAIVSCLVACGKTGGGKDYVSELKLDMTTTSLKQEVEVKTFIDGDTTHFHVPTSVSETGVLKARYLAINTPESTGKIEEWGKKASDFTKSKLKNAESIIVESDNETWNVDSTGDRYLVWVWYRESADSDYRNLNLEILQNGLAIASNTAQNRYGDICIKALDQAKRQELHVHSEENDPDFFYGAAYHIDMKELRTNIESYVGAKVAVEGVVTSDSGDSGVYVESYDEESGLYFGIYVYYGFNLSGGGLKILSVGNKVRIVGNVSEFNGTYQISGLDYNARKPDDPNNLKKLGEGEAAYTEMTANDFVNGKATVTVGGEDGEEVEYSLQQLILHSSVSMNNLYVKKVHTTESTTDSNGALSLTCVVDGVEVTVRTNPLYHANGEMVTADYFEGKTIDVKGVVDVFYLTGEYQIKVLSLDNISFD